MKIICVGLNYQLHIDEMERKFSEPTAPVLFLKPETALLANEKKEFYIPDFTTDLHYEIEIVIRIEKAGKNIAERFAHRYYNSISLGIDFTARDIQADLKAKGLPWEISKSFDNSAVVGRWISKDNFDLTNINFQLVKNENTVQSGNSADMIHSIDQIIAYASQYFTLKAGDLIFTGTPAGVGKVNIGDTLKGILGDDEIFNVKIC